MNKQAVLLAAASRTAEVAGLKRDLEQAQGELGLTKRQLEENKGKRYPVHISYRGEKISDAKKKRHDFLIGATTKVAALKKALSEAEDKAATEH